MDRFFLKRDDEKRRYVICDKVSHTGFVYQTGHVIAEVYDLNMAQWICDTINKEERRQKTGTVTNSQKRSEREGQI